MQVSSWIRKEMEDVKTWEEKERLRLLEIVFQVLMTPYEERQVVEDEIYRDFMKIHPLLQVKRIYGSMCCFAAELAKMNASQDELRSFLSEELGLSSHVEKTSIFTAYQAYLEHSRGELRLLGVDIPSLVDFQWRLIHTINSGPNYLVEYKLRSNSTGHINTYRMSCSRQDLQHMLFQIQSASRSVLEKSISYTNS